MTISDPIENITKYLRELSVSQVVAIENLAHSMLPLSKEVDFQFSKVQLESLKRSRADILAGRVMSIDEFDKHTHESVEALYK